MSLRLIYSFLTLYVYFINQFQPISVTISMSTKFFGYQNKMRYLKRLESSKNLALVILFFNPLNHLTTAHGKRKSAFPSKTTNISILQAKTFFSYKILLCLHFRMVVHFHRHQKTKLENCIVCTTEETTSNNNKYF